MFGFSDKHNVISWKDGEINSFTVKKTNDENYATIQENPIRKSEIDKLDISQLNKKSKVNKINIDQLHGTAIKCSINEKYIEIDELKSFISMKFGANPHFEVYINENKLTLFDTGNHDSKTFYFDEKDENTIEIFKIPRDQYNKKFSLYQTVWWINNRAVEDEKWKDLNINLNSKKPDENKYIFVIKVDFLEKIC